MSALLSIHEVTSILPFAHVHLAPDEAPEGDEREAKMAR
jgi:hypothetical protein